MEPWDAVPGILELLRTFKGAGAGRDRLPDLCAGAVKSTIWRDMKSVDADRDVADAARWLEENLAARPGTTGIYLGLDTLNMGEGAGHNVEIGGSEQADPAGLDTEWAFDNSWYGESHLIRGLVDMHALYSTGDKGLFRFADYALFLGYSGIVLQSAVERLAPGIRSGRNGRLYLWGFHDGDLFPLCRSIGKDLTRLAVEG